MNKVRVPIDSSLDRIFEKLNKEIVIEAGDWNLIALMNWALVARFNPGDIPRGQGNNMVGGDDTIEACLDWMLQNAYLFRDFNDTFEDETPEEWIGG